jgi:Icc-related predicted phosphoesterase
VKILLVSDRISQTLYHPTPLNTIEEVEIVISCGDLPGHYLDFLVSTLNVPCFHVPGNHDLEFEKDSPPGWISLDGKIVTYKDTVIAGLGGCRRYSPGPHQYSESEMKNRWLKMLPSFWRHGKNIDILATHAPAEGLGDLDNDVHCGFKIFRHIIDKYNPRYHFHGHVHLNYSTNPRILEYEGTTIVNSYEHYIITFNKLK